MKSHTELQCIKCSKFPCSQEKRDECRVVLDNIGRVLKLNYEPISLST